MPDGWIDNLLNDISKKTPEDVLLKKYTQLKGDRERLKDFGAFAYGVSKGKVKREEIRNYFPEYFGEQPTAVSPQSTDKELGVGDLELGNKKQDESIGPLLSLV